MNPNPGAAMDTNPIGPADWTPDHYRGDGMQPFDVINAFGLDFYEGNALKYLLRWRKKNGVEDLRKARTYLQVLIDQHGFDEDPEAPQPDTAGDGDLNEARMWARHGYEIGQRHCSWSDHGVAPAWLTEGWPNSFDSCEHLKQASEYDTALTRVRSLPLRPEAMDPKDPYSPDYLRGYRMAISAAKSAASNEPAVGRDASAVCCVCGSGSVTYRNYREQPFCWRCADCDCDQVPCVRVGINANGKQPEQPELSDGIVCGERPGCDGKCCARLVDTVPAAPKPSVIAALRREIDNVKGEAGTR